MEITEDLIQGIKNKITEASNVSGRINSFDGLVIECDGFPTSVGSICKIESNQNSNIYGEVIGFRNGKNQLIPYESLDQFYVGSVVKLESDGYDILAGEEYLGRVIDGLGHPLDKLGPINTRQKWPINGMFINPFDRPKISQIFDLGVVKGSV